MLSLLWKLTNMADYAPDYVGIVSALCLVARASLMCSSGTILRMSWPPAKLPSRGWGLGMSRSHLTTLVMLE